LLYGLLADSAMIMGSINIQPSKHIRYLTDLSPIEQSILSKCGGNWVRFCRIGELVDVQRYNGEKLLEMQNPAILFDSASFYGYIITNPRQVDRHKGGSYTYILSLRNYDSCFLSYLCAYISTLYVRTCSRLVNYRWWYGLTLEEVRSIAIPLKITPIGTPDWDYISKFIKEYKDDDLLRNHLQREIEQEFQFSQEEIDYMHKGVTRRY